MVILSLINILHDQFLDEAKKSPILLSDLANLEKYISESYSERSLIELIQNADDANSTRFYIELINDNAVLVANNGDYFSEDDVIALCRSGSSTKKRKSNTIGYRGIGFKSIVNYTNTVHLISGDIKLSFSKELTKKDLPEVENVPLVRIPHEFCGNEFENEINKVINEGYTTVFIFETKFDSILEEINSFDDSCLLFLRNLEHFESKTNTYKKINSIRKNEDNQNFISLTNGAENTDWLILTKEYENEKIDIAFLLENKNVKSMNKEKAVIHSFMPTKNQFCIPCKVNGDFSTDPSRTKIVIDDESINTIKSLSDFFTYMISDILQNKHDDFKLISVISKIFIDPLSKFKSKNINDIFIDELKATIHKHLNKEDILIQPKWLSEDSFIEIFDSDNKLLISDSLESKIPGIKQLLLNLNFEEAEFNEAMIKASNNEFSEDTRVDLVVKSIEKTRFTIDSEDKKAITNAKIIDTGENIETIKNKSNKKVKKSFISKVEEKLSDKNDLKHFAKSFDMEYEGIDEEKEVKKPQIIENNTNVSFKRTNLTKWRKVEQNVTEFLKECDNLKNVQDVSTINLGYDTSATNEKGEDLFFEIKSVKSLGDSITMTNNEYSNAHKYKENYYLVIASQNQSSLEMVFISNPIENLQLNKRVVRWEWVCDGYDGKYFKTDF